MIKKHNNIHVQPWSKIGALNRARLTELPPDLQSPTRLSYSWRWDWLTAPLEALQSSCSLAATSLGPDCRMTCVGTSRRWRTVKRLSCFNVWWLHRLRTTRVHVSPSVWVWAQCRWCMGGPFFVVNNSMLYIEAKTHYGQALNRNRKMNAC